MEVQTDSSRLNMVVDQNAHIDQEVVDAISALGNSKRLEILLALDKVEEEHQKPWHTMTFTELYGAVDVDSSSQFSYHLDQLVGQFVSETPDGYRLTYSGNKIVRTVVSDVYESTSAFEDSEVAGACLFCEETSLLATLDAEQFRIRCTSCDAILVTDFFPKSQTRGRTTEEIIESFGYRIWSMYIQLRGDVCPECFGRVDTAVDVYEHDGKTIHLHVSSCRECQHIITIPIEVTVAFHPAVLYLLWEHGISLLDVPLWEFFEFITSDVIVTDIVSDDPFVATFEITLDDEVIRLKMDDTETVSIGL
ncbi:ArsR family transcriptional regulator [Haloterrigena sp. H1]|uniref:ArsR/SmtB family transcription factor n=1 Tax=Haloterrigena sp. H1 TaxID=2552943 RepID=UPI00110E1554|nr:winged helix-turn-helix domain-containing protein [Haloterrigena sp. H1]TMT81748.1 ArsR family transcriptional regulator [Haloterrigena sp. H1]